MGRTRRRPGRRGRAQQEACGAEGLPRPSKEHLETGLRGPKPAARAQTPQVASDDPSRRTFRPYHALAVPRGPQPLGASGEGEQKQRVTTAMLRNIPNKYTQNSLLEEIHEAGFADTYDFFYLPMDVHNRANVGYAFINFLDTMSFEKFTAAFTDYVFQKHQSLKIARVSPAHLQGLLENLRHFSNRAVTWSRNSQYRPIVRHRGNHRDLCELLAELEVQEGASSSSSLAGDVPSHLNPEAAEFVPAAPGACEPGRTRLRPDAGEFIPQAMLGMPDFSEASPDAAEPAGFAAAVQLASLRASEGLRGPHLSVAAESQAALELTELPGADMMDMSALAFSEMEMEVAPPPGLGGLYFGGMFSGYENICTSEEPVPEIDAPPGMSENPAESFTLDKHGLEEAVSLWLQAPSAVGSSSTRTGSNGTTPRSVGTPENLESERPEAA